MEDPTVAALQLYTPGIYNVLVNLASSAVLYGVLTILSIVSTGHLIRRNIRQRSTALMFTSLIVLYASTTVHLGAVIAFSVGYCRLLNALSAFPSSSSVQTAIYHFQRIAETSSYGASFALAINAAIGDAIVWWRACVLWRRKSMVVLGILFQAGTFGLGVLSITRQITQINYYNQLFLHFADTYGAVCAFASLLTNVVATLLIGWKAWEHRKVLLLAQGGGPLKGRWITPTMRVLVVLVESGLIYSAFLAVAAVYDVVGRSRSITPSEAEFLSAIRVYLPGCFPPILAIYPTVIIFIVALNKSLIDGTGSLASPSDIPSDIVPSIVFRGSHSDTHISPSATLPLRGQHASASPENGFTEELGPQELENGP